MRCNLIAAISKNNGIGFKGKLPWHIKADLQYFSKLTIGQGNNAIIMGYNTYQSLQGHLLKNRTHLVLSSQHEHHHMNHQHLNLKFFTSLNTLQNYLNLGVETFDEIWLIGGAQIYKLFLEQDLVHTCYITYIDKEFECDTYFPAALDIRSKAITTISSSITYDEKYDCEVKYEVYEMNK
jgi:dihydrofolate reductase